MQPKNKKILKIILIILTIILIGLLIWLFLLKDIISPRVDPSDDPSQIVEPPRPGGIVPEPPISPITPPQTDIPTLGTPGTPSTPGVGLPAFTPTDLISGYASLLFEPTLRRVSNEPIAGSVIFNKGGRQFIRFTDRATGHIYETDAEIINLNKISNTTVPKIYEAIWQGSGEGAVYRFIRPNGNIASFAGTIRETGNGEFRGQFLPDNISSLSVSKTDSALLYVEKNLSGFGSLIIASFFGNNKNELWTSPLSEWLPIFSKNGTPALVSKASETSPGSLVVFNRQGSIREYLVSGIYGLSSSLSPNSTRAIYSDSRSKPIRLWLKVSGESPRAIGLKTLGEKCAWQNEKIVFCAIPETLPTGEYPDEWYQGVISFKDEIYVIDVDSGVFNQLINLSRASGSNFDVDLIEVSENGKFLTLRNKNDLILWSLQILP